MLPAMMKSKICLVGDLAVGKTSLIRRFTLDTFDDVYLTTLGTKVSKKSIDVTLPGYATTMRMDMLIWDIMGQHAFQELLKDSYFYGVRGVLAVADLTRLETLNDIDLWVDLVESVTGEVPMLLVVNKADLEDRAAFGPKQIEAVANAFGCEYMTTSAKTNTRIEEAFQKLAQIVAVHQLRSPDDSS